LKCAQKRPFDRQHLALSNQLSEKPLAPNNSEIKATRGWLFYFLPVRTRERRDSMEEK
jgi:hypothetical protein